MTFHVHMNALHLADRIQEAVFSTGMERADFRGIAAFANQYAAKKHYSYRSSDREDALKVFNACTMLLRDDLVGFIELEQIVYSKVVPLRDASLNSPEFFLHLKPPTCVRETEIHVSIPDTGQNVALVAGLQDAGFYRTSLRRHGSDRVILTAQGANVPIAELGNALVKYLAQEASGNGNVKVKEEKLLEFSASDGFNWFAPQCVAVGWRT